MRFELPIRATEIEMALLKSLGVVLLVLGVAVGSRDGLAPSCVGFMIALAGVVLLSLEWAEEE